MTKFKITYTTSTEAPEVVEGDSYKDDGEWTDFIAIGEGGGHNQVLRVKAKNVKRIERLPDGDETPLGRQGRGRRPMVA